MTFNGETVPAEASLIREYIIPFIIIAANFLPIYGVTFLEWEILPLFLLYWVENLIIGVFIFFLILYTGAKQGVAVFAQSLFTAAFFTVHYGMFCMCHGVFIFELFGNTGDVDMTAFFPFSALFKDLHIPGFFWAVLGIFAAEFFQTVFVSLKRDGISNPKAVMFSPYGRIVILHVTIIFGGLLAQSLGSPLWALMMLILLKTAYDFIMFKRKTNDKPEPS